VDTVPDPLLLRESSSAWNRTRASGSVASNSGHCTTETVLSLLSPDLFHCKQFHPYFLYSCPVRLHVSSFTSVQLGPQSFGTLWCFQYLLGCRCDIIASCGWQLRAFSTLLHSSANSVNGRMTFLKNRYSRSDSLTIRFVTFIWIKDFL
jgi:hypothetical protein